MMTDMCDDNVSGLNPGVFVEDAWLSMLPWLSMLILMEALKKTVPGDWYFEGIRCQHIGLVKSVMICFMVFIVSSYSSFQK